MVPELIESRGYGPLELSETILFSPDNLKIYEAVACADIAFCLVDSKTPESQFLRGAIQSTFIPSIDFSVNAGYSFNPDIPEELQARVVRKDKASITQMINAEFDICEEDFIELDREEEVEVYTNLLIEVASQKGRYTEGTRNYFVNGVYMESKYKNTGGNVGAFGDKAHAENVIQVSNQSLDSIDMETLVSELSTLWKKAREEATDVEHDRAVLEIREAEEALKSGDKSKVIGHLKSAGKWALDVATKIGTGVAAEAIKKSIGL